MNINFNQIHNQRKSFIKENKTKDFVIIDGQKPILISAPHGVMQFRKGKNKVAEIGSLATALCLQKQTKSFLIAKTKNKNDDANWDKKSAYKQALWKTVKKHNIKYVLDFHGLAAWREMDVNLGTNFGNNVSTNPTLFNDLLKLLKKNNFIVSVDTPFAGGERTIAGHTKNELNNVWTIQIEINSQITNVSLMEQKFSTLLDVFTQWINNLR